MGDYVKVEQNDSFTKNMSTSDEQFKLIFKSTGEEKAAVRFIGLFIFRKCFSSYQILEKFIKDQSTSDEQKLKYREQRVIVNYEIKTWQGKLN